MPLIPQKEISYKNIKPYPGLYHYQMLNKNEKLRAHLRVEEDRSGTLMVNASRVVHLNPTATVMSYLILNRTQQQKAIRSLRKTFNISRKKAKTDFTLINQQLNEILQTDGLCPVCDLNLDNTMPFSSRPSAPYRMDLALTYRCNNACKHCYNPENRNLPELEIKDWKNILDRVWDLGIPHIVFTGGEPTLFEGLHELVNYAEEKGLITGINTNGRMLADKQYLNKLVEAGLDHIQITLESHDPKIHDLMVSAKGAWEDTVAGITNSINTNLYVMTNTTLLEPNSPYLLSTLKFLATLGVPTIGLNALIYAGKGAKVNDGIEETKLPALLETARNFTKTSGQKLIWYTPTQYCHFNPILLQLGIKGCTAALYNMCIEPDGSVLPCQSYYHPLGNFLMDSWDSIWQHPLAISIRERKEVPEQCKICDFLRECGGGCPLARNHQSPVPIIKEFQ